MVERRAGEHKCGMTNKGVALCLEVDQVGSGGMEGDVDGGRGGGGVGGGKINRARALASCLWRPLFLQT